MKKRRDKIEFLPGDGWIKLAPGESFGWHDDHPFKPSLFDLRQWITQIRGGVLAQSRAVAAVSGIGGAPNIRAGNGGLDANWMVRHGILTVTFGAGQNEAHTIDEWINFDEYDRACALAVRLATTR